ncbi:MAG: FGGY family carbohydrate kinase [Pseudomonadota bacterium]
MHGATLLDAADTVVSPGMLWNDARRKEEAATLDGRSAFRKLTGKIVFPGVTAPKPLWPKAHEPERLLAVRGGSNSGYWLSAIAAARACPVSLPEDGDFGAAGPHASLDRPFVIG